MTEKHSPKLKYLMVGLSILALVGLAYAGFQYYLINNEAVENTVQLEKTILDLQDKNILLARNLKAEKDRNDSFAGQIQQIAGTVGTLDKLAKTDKELLQKYSKIYFLNEHYVPDSLIEIPKEYNQDQNRTIESHTKVWPYLERMIKDAKVAGWDIKLISGYRSFGTQSALKNQYSVTYGTGANRFSADQGYSEHQLGTAFDLTTAQLGANFTDFADTNAYKWLVDNAHKYGFVLSYPPGNAFYQYEPWHWRFVGKQLAKRLHEDQQYFYNLDQPTIDLYLISIFD